MSLTYAAPLSKWKCSKKSMRLKVDCAILYSKVNGLRCASICIWMSTPAEGHCRWKKLDGQHEFSAGPHLIPFLHHQVRNLLFEISAIGVLVLIGQVSDFVGNPLLLNYK